MRLRELVETSRSVGEVSGRLEKIGRLAALLERLAPEEIEIATSFLTGSPRQGRIGVGWALISEARAASVPFDASGALTAGECGVGVCAGRGGRSFGRGGFGGASA